MTDSFLYALQLDQKDTKLACDHVNQFLENVLHGLEDDRHFYDLFHELVYRIFGFSGQKCWLREVAKYPLGNGGNINGNEMNHRSSGSGGRDKSSPARFVKRLVQDVVTGGDNRTSSSSSFNSLWQSLFHLLHPTGPLFRVMYKSLAITYEFPVSKLPFGISSIIESDISMLPPFYMNKFTTHHSANLAPDSITLNIFEYYMFCFAYFVHNPSTDQMSVYPSARQRKTTFSQFAGKLLESTASRKRAFSFSPVRELLHVYTKYFCHTVSLGTASQRQEHEQCSNTLKEYMNQSTITLLQDTYLQIVIDTWINQMRQDLSYVTDPQGRFVQRVDRVELRKDDIRKATGSLVCMEFVLKYVLSDKNLVDMIASYQTGKNGNQFTTRMMMGYQYGTPTTRALSMLQIPLFQFLYASYISRPELFRGTTEKLPISVITRIWLTLIVPWAKLKDLKEEARAQNVDWDVYIASNWPFYSTIFLRFLDLFLEFSSRDDISDNDLIILRKVLQVYTQEDYLLFKHLSEMEHKMQDPNSQESYLMLLGQGNIKKDEPIFTLENRQRAELLIARLKSIILNRGSIQPSTFMFFDDKKPERLTTTLVIKDICMMLATLFQMDKSSIFADAELQQISRDGKKDTLRNRHENQLVPETVSGLMRLTERGRLQVAAGERKCSKYDIRYLGDELYRPVTTLENEFLVRVMVYLTERFQPPFSLRPFASYPVMFVMGVCFIAIWSLLYLLGLVFRLVQ